MVKEELIKRVKHNHAHYPPKTEERINAHEQVRIITAECAIKLIELCPVCPELEKALLAMEDAMMYSNAAIARSE